MIGHITILQYQICYNINSFWNNIIEDFHEIRLRTY